MLPIMRIVFLFISLSISLHATVSKAEPSTHIKTLMDQPLSMLDWGLYSVENFLENHTHWEEENKPTFSVSYDWDPDEIKIYVSRWSKKFETYEAAEQECKFYFDKIDTSLLIRDGKDILDDYQVYGNFFTHNGWKTDSMDNAKKNVGNRTVLKIKFGSHTCSRKLMASKFSVTKG